MLNIPELVRAFEWENAFYLTCGSSRLAKVIARYELFKIAQAIPGAIVDCGVYKGISLLQFAMLRDLFQRGQARRIVGFDVFGRFPETAYEPDEALRRKFIAEAGAEGIGVEQLKELLRHKQCERDVELVVGDICKTVPEYVAKNPELEISLLDLDTDIYEPAVVILEHLYPRIASGGVLILDDYGVFPGETKAVDDYFKGRDVEIRKLPFAATPSYLIKP